MINDGNEWLIGFDLNKSYSQITFYNRQTKEPVTVSTVEGQEKYLIPTPKDLFPMVEDKVELGLALLSNFFRECMSRISENIRFSKCRVMVTMEQMTEPWISYIPDALAMLGIERDRVFLQDYLESFYYYVLNQKKELWNKRVALFQYEGDTILFYELQVDYRTKPAFVRVVLSDSLVLDKKVREGRSEVDWTLQKDELFYQMIYSYFEAHSYTAAYLIGEKFDKTWAVKSLNYLCTRRHVFLGRNLYTKGACFGALSRSGVKPLKDFLYKGEDMVDVNIGMHMSLRGREMYYLCVSAGLSWYESYHHCEFIPDGTEEVVLFVKPMDGSDLESHTIPLTGLPKRPNKTLRLQMDMKFKDPRTCQVVLRDMGFGGLIPSTGLSWESILEV